MVIKKNVLVVEDSMEDYEMIKEAFEEDTYSNIFHCIDGDEALDFLQETHTKEKPYMVLLDLNLPGTDGFEVLQEIKKNKVLKKIPVVVLTTSNNEEDIKECYEMGANSYVQKPMDFEEFLATIKHLKKFWCDIAISPEKSE